MNDTKETKELYKKESIAKSFDLNREKYAHQEYKHKTEANLIQKTLKKIPSKEIKILDVACGTGRMLSEVFKVNKNIHYFGLDTSKEMTNVLKKKALKLGKEKLVKIKFGNANKIPFKDNAFDLVFTYHLLWHLEKKDQEKIISEMIRVTKKNGFIIFDALNENFIWEKIKILFGKNSKGLNKLNLHTTKLFLMNNQIRKIEFIEKLSDARINSNFWYSIFNIINKIRSFLPTSFYHMFYIVGKK